VERLSLFAHDWKIYLRIQHRVDEPSFSPLDQLDFASQPRELGLAAGLDRPELSQLLFEQCRVGQELQNMLPDEPLNALCRHRASIATRNDDTLMPHTSVISISKNQRAGKASPASTATKKSPQ
jgi:hypothetical protein